MTNLIGTPVTVRVEIVGGTITKAAMIIGATGRRLDFSDIGQMRFFVDVIAEDGTRIGMWEGANYETAILTAHELAEEWKCQVYDNLIGDAT
ncbi:hypothetical protein NA8A_22396 [Nitratireductor indicus C115]|uniref:Uncharacterized protein n=1 Tax=Nitratireductor indicus C115 TaxID=1231190 RepID=K2NYM4_9HYPH|nr:hypothetical protein [Nitratireductor indicus]EKF40166.1 hypothetical protein NA8A_22396 [Nitratireductor indicus C115]SFQ80227.1 hypothetical protein SAMN05216176_11788 [Nitratireductor indicus]